MRGVTCSIFLTFFCLVPGVHALPLSSGDTVKVTILDGDELSGVYDIDLSGNLNLPYLKPISAIGLEPSNLQSRINRALVLEGLYQREFARSNVSVVRWAPVNVFVSGSVFDPGRVEINRQPIEAKISQPITSGGSSSLERFLSAALRYAGGITPNADIRNISVIRDGARHTYDFSGIFTGTPVSDVPLVEGDQVIVPTLPEADPELVRPSQISPPGVKIFISNLTVPATGNAISAVGREATEFVYGARFSQAVVSGNCAGGTRITNAARSAILARTDRRTGQVTYLKRGVQDLLMHTQDGKDNPYLLTGDAVACYDSTFTNIKDIFSHLGIIVGPFIQPWGF